MRGRARRWCEGVQDRLRNVLIQRRRKRQRERGRESERWKMGSCQMSVCTIRTCRSCWPLCYTLPYPYHTLPYPTLPFHTILLYTVLYYTMLYYGKLYYTRARASCPYGARRQAMMIIHCACALNQQKITTKKCYTIPLQIHIHVQ